MVAGPSTIVTSATLQHRVSSGTDVGCSGVVAAAAVAAAAAAAEDSKHSGTTSSDAGVEPYKFLAVHEVPEWLRNPHQHQGYRAPHLSFAQCCMTGLMLHNESWSIWSALVVFVTFLAAIPFVATRPELLGNHSVDDKVRLGAPPHAHGSHLAHPATDHNQWPFAGHSLSHYHLRLLPVNQSINQS